MSGDGYWDNVWLKVPFCAVYWGRRMSADQAFTQVFGDKSDWNDTNWKDPTFQKIIADARTAAEIATELDADPEDVYHCLTHMSANGEVQIAIGKDPSGDTFSL